MIDLMIRECDVDLAIAPASFDGLCTRVIQPPWPAC